VEVMEAIRSRRSIRKFKDEPVPADVLSRLEEAFVRSPSASNAQEGHMVLVSDGEQVRRVERFAPGLSGKPPALIVLCCNQEVALEGGGQEGAELLRYMNVGFSAAEIILAALRHPGPNPCCPSKGGSPMTDTDNTRRQSGEPDSAVRSEYADLVAFILTSAHGLYREPHSYGPMRLMDVLSKLHALCERMGVTSEEISEIVSLIGDNRPAAFHDPERFVGVLDRAIVQLADYTAQERCRRSVSRSSPLQSVSSC